MNLIFLEEEILLLEMFFPAEKGLARSPVEVNTSRFQPIHCRERSRKELCSTALTLHKVTDIKDAQLLCIRRPVCN